MYLPVQIQIQQVMTDILYDGCTTETKKHQIYFSLLEEIYR